MDYANRKRPAPRKPGQPNKRKPHAQKAPVSWRLVALTLLLVAALSYGLYHISGSAERAAEVTQPVLKPPVKSTEPLPELPTDEWSYIDELENQEIEVEVPDRPDGPPKLMQCGSFRSQADAETLKARIAMAGLESQVRRSEGRNGVWYRVILGPYATKRDAERDRHKLQRAQVLYCEIWNWNL